MKFKNYIETESGIKDTSTSPGTAGQLLSSTVAGTSWIDQDTIHSGSSEVVDIQVKNISSANGGVNLSKGDPVYIYGSVGASPRLYVDLADADSTATNNLGDGKMPCVGLLDQDLTPNQEGTATVVGKLRNLITSPIDGATPNENNTVYVKSGGGLTLTKPTGSTNLIQNVGQVGRVSTSADGNIVVAALLRSNDVPNLPTGRIWVGDGNTTVSDVVYLDETNERMGVGAQSPTEKLTVGDSTSNAAVKIISYNNTVGTEAILKFCTTAAIQTDEKAAIIVKGLGGSFGKNDMHFALDSAADNSNVQFSDTKMTILNGGNVGIGTTSPQAKLAVAGDTNIGGYVEVSDGLGGDRVLTLQSNAGYFGIGDIDGLADQAFISGDGSSISINTNQNTTLHCDFNNRVGIGTTSPQAKLHVANGTLRTWTPTSGTSAIFESTASNRNFLTLTAANEAELWFGNASTQTLGRIRYEMAGNNMEFWTNATQKMVINSSGNVGIGTTLPNAKTHIFNGTAQNGLIVENSSSSLTDSAIFANNTSTTNGNLLRLRSSGSDRMVVSGQGNVGIGTTSPAKKLTIGGIGLGNTDGLKIEDPSNTAYGAHYSYNDGSTTVEIGGVVNNVLRDCISIARDATRTITINTSENVGIGTTNPTAILHVEGSKDGPVAEESRAIVIGNNTKTNAFYNNGIGVFGKTIQSNGMAIHGDAATGGGFGGYFTGRGYFSGNVGIGTTVANVRLEIGGGSSLARVIPSVDNQGYIGDSQHRWQAIYATNGTIQTSDIREKTEIKPTKLGLDFINDLNPVSYKWIEGERLDASKDERNHQGLIAQEVAETLEKHGVDKNKFGGLDIQKTDEYYDFHAMSYEQLIAPMIKAIQELKTEIEELKKQINK